MSLHELSSIDNTTSRLWFLLPLVLLLVSCSAEQSAMGPGSLTGPGGVQLGMTRQEVIQVMLDEVQLLQMSGHVTNPYATRYIDNIDGESLEVMYYYLGRVKGDDLVTDEELVPVILKDNSVVGWGWETLEVMTGLRPSP
jgi:hypothetical protein